MLKNESITKTDLDLIKENDENFISLLEILNNNSIDTYSLETLREKEYSSSDEDIINPAYKTKKHYSTYEETSDFYFSTNHRKSK